MHLFLEQFFFQSIYKITIAERTLCRFVDIYASHALDKSCDLNLKLQNGDNLFVCSLLSYIITS